MSSRCVGLLIGILWIPPALAAEYVGEFEGVGEIQAVELTANAIKLYNKTYKLSAEIKINNVQAIYSLQQGCQIAYNGKVIDKVETIEALYVFDKGCLK